MVFMASESDHGGRNFGIFLGHTFIVTETGNECVTPFSGSWWSCEASSDVAITWRAPTSGVLQHCLL